MAALGLAFVLLLGGTVTVILKAFGGDFSNYSLVFANVPAAGNGISAGSPVVYRDITVGAVQSLGRQLPGGVVHAVLHLNPGVLQEVPHNVEADVGITTAFGTQGVTLKPAGSSSRSHLHAGQTIPVVNRSETTTLQGTVTDLDNVLNALHPAALDSALTAIATALHGRGHALGHTIDGVAQYLGEMLPLLPSFEHDVRLAAPVTGDLGADAPDLLGALASGSVTAATLSKDADLLHQTLVGGTTLSNSLSYLTTATQASFEDLVANAAPLLSDLNQNPQEIASTMSGIAAWSEGFAAAESSGPFLKFTGQLDLDGTAQCLLAAAGGGNSLAEQCLGASNFNPPTYTAADCPTYGSEQGPNCPAITGSAITTSAEERAAATMAAQLNGGKAVPSASIATLLLEPLLVRLSGAS
jgi:phospholipid/cholesterol/gamma-HCH transport system substrate-binding protein